MHLGAALTLALLCGCAGGRAVPLHVSEWIALARNGASFELNRSHTSWEPRGFNYDHDDTPQERLIEDYWSAEWPRVVRDFHTMRSSGATLVRIHLQLGRFMRSATEPDVDALVQLRRLVSLAENEGLFLDLTGLRNYRAADTPSWYQELAESERWAVQARFWRAVSAAVAESPGVFCFNIMNEPAVPAETQTSWLAPPWLNGRSYVEYVARDLRGRARSDIGLAWLRMMVSAIRSHDHRHLVTVGSFLVFDQAANLPIGLTPAQLAAEVDFLSVHLYPVSGHLDVALKEIDELTTGRPLLIEESGPLSCTREELRGLIERARGRVAGWLGFFWGGKTADLQ